NQFPNIPAPVAPNDPSEPFWNNITFENITVANPGPDGGSAAKIYGLNSSPLDLDGVNFMNINMVTKGAWTMAYAGDVYMNNVTVNGVNLPNSEANVLSGGGVTESK